MPITILGVFFAFSNPIDPAILIGAIAGIVGGVVVLGSNATTSKQIGAAMKAAETQRAKLIDTIDLRAVDALRR